MRRIFFFILVALTLITPSLAQVPDGVHFQAIARDASGFPYSGTAITVEFRIRDQGGVLLYQETHSATTDVFGLFKAIIGTGTPLTGTFAGIDWTPGTHQLEIDINGQPMATHAFESVPYAFMAKKVQDMTVGDLTDINLTGLTPGQTLIWDGSTWIPAAASDSIWSQLGNTTYYDQGRIGLGTDTPQTTFHIMDRGLFNDSSSLLVGQSVTGSGSKLMWYGRKAAMRFGMLNDPFGGYNYNKFWDYDSIGYYSFAGGQNSRAKGFGAFAWGSFGWADGSSSVAFFGSARGNNSYTFGGSSKGRGSFTVEGVAEEEGGIAMYGYTGGRYGVSIGGGTTGLGASSSRRDYAIAIGWNSDARGQASIALGPSDAYGYNSFSTGWVTEARGNYSSTFGYQTVSYPYASMALGRYNIISGDSAAWVATDPIFAIGDGTSNSNRSNSFVIQKNGQTAIGYNAPTGMLQVSSALGTINNGGTLDLTHATLLLGSTTTGLAFDPNQIEIIGSGLYINLNSAEDVFLTNGGGNVAIGHNVPIAKLDVMGTGWQMRIQNNNAGGGDWYMGTSSTSWAAGADKFLIGPTSSSAASSFAIENNGQIGIGTVNPSDRLHINAAAGEDALRVQTNGTTRLRVHDNGGVSIGANTGPPVAGLYLAGPANLANGLYVNGISEFDGNVLPDNDNTYDLGSPANRWDDVWATNGIIQTSDLRLKTDIHPLTDGLGSIMQLRPVRFRWREASPDGNPKIGLIAQEVQNVIPEVVHQPDPDAPLGVNYADMVPVLIQAIQDQQQQIDQQQQQIDALQQALKQLQAQSHD